MFLRPTECNQILVRTLNPRCNWMNLTRHAKKDLRTYAVTVAADQPANRGLIYTVEFTANVSFFDFQADSVALQSESRDVQSYLGLH